MLKCKKHVVFHLKESFLHVVHMSNDKMSLKFQPCDGKQKEKKQNVKNRNKYVYSRKYNFIKEGKKYLPDADKANEIITKKINKLKRRGKINDNTELQIIYILQYNIPISGKIFKLSDAIYYPSDREGGFGSIDMITEEFFVKSVIINYFK